jgi:hypothetical protein
MSVSHHDGEVQQECDWAGDRYFHGFDHPGPLLEFVLEP